MIIRKGIILTVIAFAVVYTTIIFFSDFSSISQIISLMKIELIPLIFGIEMFSFFIRSLRQKYFLKNIGIEISFKKNFVLFLSGLFMNISPGGIGSSIKYQFLKNEFGVQRRKTVPIFFFEKYHDLLSVVTFMIIFSLFYTTLISEIILIISTILVTFGFVILRRDSVLKWMLKRIFSIKILKKYVEQFDPEDSSFSSFTKKKPFFYGWSLSLSSNFFSILAVFLVFVSFSQNISFFESSQLYLTSLLAGIFSFLPGGVGITESSFLSLLMIYGYDFTLASSLVLIIRILTLWFSVFVGFITIKFVKI